MNTYTIYQGDTTPIIYVRPGPLNPGDSITADWTCKIKVVDSQGATLVDTRTVTQKATVPIKNEDGSKTNEECFMVYLDPDETRGLSESIEGTEHIWAFEISNTTTTPKFNKETHQKLIINEQKI